MYTLITLSQPPDGPIVRDLGNGIWTYGDYLFSPTYATKSAILRAKVRDCMNDDPAQRPDVDNLKDFIQQNWQAHAHVRNIRTRRGHRRDWEDYWLDPAGPERRIRKRDMEDVSFFFPSVYVSLPTYLPTYLPYLRYSLNVRVWC